MDLERALRVTLALLTASGAYALYDAGAGWQLLAAVLAAGFLAYRTVHAGRWRPLPPLAVSVGAAALLLYFLLPSLTLLRQQATHMAGLNMARFLVFLQMLVFFAPLKSSPLFTYGGGSLFVVLVSATLSPGLGLVLRLVLYLVALTAVLFVHALWRERLRFEQEYSSSAVPAGQGEPARGLLPGAAARQGLKLAGSVAVFCMVCGFLLFFAWPRLSPGAFAWVRGAFPLPGSRPADDRGGYGGGEGTDYVNPTTGDSERMDLDFLGPIREDHTPAVRVTFEPPAREWAGGEGRILLRGRVYRTYLRSSWAPAHPNLFRERREDASGAGIVFPTDRAPYLAPPGPEVRQQVRFIQRPGEVYMTLAPLRRLERPAVLVDEEGVPRTLKDQPLRPDDPEDIFVAVSRAPVRLAHLPTRAQTGRPGVEYLEWRQLQRPDMQEQVESLAATLTRRLPSDLHKAQRILGQLRDSGRYRYSLRVERLHPEGDRLGEFLFGDDSQRRGPCGYFATAFVILCRAAGLPARLATGYAHSLRTQESGADVTFRNSDAHAWGEVYFEDAGWVAFDPTPASSDPRADETAGPQGGSTEDSSAPDPSRTGVHDWLNRRWSYVLGYGRHEQGRVYSAATRRLADLCSAAGRLLSGSGAVLGWALVAALGLGLVWLLWRGQRRRQRRWAALPPRLRAAVAFYDELLQLLARRGFVRRAGRTPREFATAVLARGGPALAPVLEMTEVFERVRYGGEALGDAELDRMRGALRYLQAALPPPRRG